MHRLSLRATVGVLTAFTLFLGSGACVTRRAVAVQPARDLPDHFLVGLPSGSTAEPVAGEGCRNPMVDPRDGSLLRLVRSAEARGDYQVPGNRYGVGAGQLLRLNCATGVALGVVRNDG